MPATLQPRPYAETLNSFLQKLETTKKASDSRGETSHPSKGEDEKLQEATEGARSSENEKDVKATVPAGGVNSASENTGGENDGMMNIGVTQSTTGEHPAVEDDYKDRAKDTPTDHPANTSVGPKYSAMNLRTLKSEFAKLANDLLADIVVKTTNTPAEQSKTTDKQAAQTTSTPATAPTATEKPEQKAAAAGQELAQSLSTIPGTDKLAHEILEAAIRDAVQDADAVGKHLATLRKKKAGEEELPDESTEGETNEEEIEGGSEGDALAALAGGGGDAAGMPPPDAMGGMGGGPEMGAPPGPGGPGGPGGGGNEEQAIQMLLMALEELGLIPDQLSQAPPPPPEAMAAGAPDGAKLAKAATAFMRSGKYERRLSKNADERHKINFMKQYVRELLGDK